MTNKKAIRVLENIEHYLKTHTNESCEEEHTAIDLAIKALEERPQGKWIKQYRKSYRLITDEGTLIGEFTKCPKCLYDKARGSNFCPDCGADMRGENGKVNN